MYTFCFLVCNTILYAQPQTMWQLLMDGTIIKWAYAGGDEFNESYFDDTKWMRHYPEGPTHGDEQQYYHSNNVELENGILKLIAKMEPGFYDTWHWDENGNFYTIPEYFDYTSGMICSKQKFKFGLFQIRFKTSYGTGFWPAFWLCYGQGTDEIDIFEMESAKPNKFTTNIHCDGGECDTPFNSLKEHTANENFPDTFNILAGEWAQDYVIFSLNGYEFRIAIHSFNYPMRIIANLAIPCEGCSFGGVAEPFPIPNMLQIDYIRFWKRLDCDEIVTLSNYSPSSSSPTTVTGKSISLNNTNLNSEEYLTLIATDQVTIIPETTLSNNFHAKIVECPGPPNFKNNSVSINHVSDNSYISTDVWKRNSQKKGIKNTLTLYANPNNGRFQVEVENLRSYYSLEITDVNGDRIYKKDNIVNPHTLIDITSHPKGVYIMKLFIENSILTEKIIYE